MKTALVLLWLATALALPAPALAWSSDGHRIVAEIAQARLSPAARAEVDRLLSGEPDPTLPGVAAWADRLRDSKEHSELGKRSSAWHYVNFHGADCAFDAARDCPGGDCVIGAINRMYLAVADRKRPDAERAQALKFLVHFVGDVHQPLHAGGAGDRGGTRHQVRFDGHGDNLHGIWDDEVLRQDLGPAAYAAELTARPPLAPDPTLRSQTPALDWAVESCRIVHADGFYPATRKVEDDYLEAQRPIAETRLRQAGARLAALLNHALAARPVSP